MMPNFSWTTLVSGARQFVVQEALETLWNKTAVDFASIARTNYRYWNHKLSPNRLQQGLPGHHGVSRLVLGVVNAHHVHGNVVLPRFADQG